MNHYLLRLWFVMAAISTVPHPAKRHHHRPHRQTHRKISPTPTHHRHIAPTAPKKEPAQAADVEQVDDLTLETPKASPTPPKAKILSQRTLGRLHAAIVHFPIAWSMLWIMVEFFYLLFARQSSNQISVIFSFLVPLSFIPAIVSGLLRAGELPQEPEVISNILLHRNVMYGCGILSIGLLLWRLRSFWRPQNLKHPFAAFGHAVLILLLAIGVGYGAHLGGRLVYGEEFLPF